jgi:hypothetical protein
MPSYKTRIVALYHEGFTADEIIALDIFPEPLVRQMIEDFA